MPSAGGASRRYRRRRRPILPRGGLALPVPLRLPSGVFLSESLGKAARRESVVRITFCGTGAGTALNPERAFSAIHLSHGDARLLLDCGPGSLERLVRAGLELRRLDALVFSHLHPDHALGLADLLSRRLIEGGTFPSIYGPRGSDAYVQASLALTRLGLEMRSGQAEALTALPVELTPPGDEREVAGLEMASVEVPHVDYLECLARRFRVAGRTLVYSGDTRPAPEIMAPLADGAHVLVHEAYTERAMHAFASSLPASEQERLVAAFARRHSVLPAVARIAEEAGVGTLVLTHLLAEESDEAMVAEAGTYFEGTVIAAADGLALEV